MKVLVSITYYHPHISGLTKVATCLAEILAGRGMEVRVLCIRHNSKMPGRSTINGVEIIRAKPDFPVGKGFVSREWFGLARRLVKGSDTVFIHLPQPEGLVIALFAKVMGKNIVSYFHCRLSLPKGVLNGLLTQIANISSLIICILSKRIFVNSSDYARSIWWIKLMKNKLISQIPPVVKYLNPVRGRKRRRKIKLVGFVGRMAKEKGIEYLIHGIKILRERDRNIQLAIAGPTEAVGERYYSQQIQSLIKQDSNWIKHLGELPDEKMKLFYRNIDLLVFPSVNSTDSLGLVQLEALANNTPLVASDLPGVRNPILKTGAGELATPGNSSSLANSIIKVLNNPEKYIDKEKIKNYLNTSDTQAYADAILNA